MNVLTSGRRLLCACLLPLALAPNGAQAALTISTTRIVYDAHQRSASVVVANPSAQPYAAQAWVNTEADDTTTSVPLVTTPALFRLNPGREQTVQINGLPNELPQDRESLFFFNLQEVPQADPDSAARNTLRIALRTRIKLFYRPTAIAGNPARELKKLEFSTVQEGGRRYLQVRNPTPYHYVFSRFELQLADQRHPLREADMLRPLETQRYAIPRQLGTSGLKVTVTFINDYGGLTQPLTLPVQDAI